MREETLSYSGKVQDEILRFLGSNIKHDYLEASRDVNLNVKLSEAGHLFNANDKIRSLAESGELQALHESSTALTNSVQTGYIAVMDQLDRTMQSVIDAESDIYSDLVDSPFEELQRIDTGEYSNILIEAISCVDAVRPLENYEIVRRVAEEKGDSDIVGAEKSLRALLATRAKIMDAKAAIQAEILEKLQSDDSTASVQELQEFQDFAKRFGIVAFSEEADLSDNVYMKQLQDIVDGDMKKLMSDIDACSAKDEEKAAVYADYYKDDATNETFRQELLRHLAGNIVVKEHRIRYQKEQFDRFVVSLNYGPLKNKDMTLGEFSTEYARLISATTESSHNYRCPKIEANYDDFGEQTVRPLNATIFFYFFSANRSGKTWAQWMLSSVRYPNDKMRRAYMRFFA